ncbi:MAG: Hsp20/alpha crystallin family protein [Erysipelotrichaceae bacterium]|nr:Hsp20/alpha crystallin family protein [Erysipelotrichaceae bacterium]MBR5048486.1 Hsp20/alpha crystallin family protein [Erysipelotrichaceae bacterium]
MLMPTIFGEDLFDDLFDTDYFDRAMKNTERKLYGHRAKNEMKTDVKENDDSYDIIMDLPGFKKEEVKISLEDGYLSITANKGLEENDTDKKSGRFIRQERYYGSMSRCFYVGKEVEHKDIKAGFENGVLTISVPKLEAKKEIPQKKYIEIG